MHLDLSLFSEKLVLFSPPCISYPYREQHRLRAAPRDSHPVGFLGSQGTDQTTTQRSSLLAKFIRFFCFDACRSLNRQKAQRRVCSYTSARHRDTLPWFSLLLEMPCKTPVKGKEQTTKLFCWIEGI